MKKSLPCFSALAALALASVAIAQTTTVPSIASAQAAAHAASKEAADRSPAGDRFLLQAISQLERRASITAHLTYHCDVNGELINDAGDYWQQGSGEDLKIRLELRFRQDSRLLQVSNGSFFYIDRRLPTGRTVTRYDLRQLRADPTLAPADLDKLDPGKANWSAIQPLLTAHSGGLPSLLAALRENFSFQPPQPMKLEIKTSEDSPATNQPVYAVVGQWKPDKLSTLLAKSDDPNSDNSPPQKSKPGKPVKIPDRVPQEVLLLVGQSDLFPYRIEYRKLETPAVNPSDGPPIPYQLSVHPLVVLELSGVVFDAPIPAGQFDYSSGDVDFADGTPALLERLRRERQEQVASRPVSSSNLPER